MRFLLAGWFSFAEMGATAGDLLARDVARGWLEDAGHAVDVAVAPPFTGGIDWRTTDPAQYDGLVFVCGPLGNGWPVTELLEHFAGRRLVALDVSMLEPLEAWNPFHVLRARDSTAESHPDISFAAPPLTRPVAGVVLVHPQTEYREPLHEVAHAAIDRLLDAHDVVPLPIDTRLDVSAHGLTRPDQVEALIARTDVVVTTRLHGLVLALRNGVPVVAIDPIAGGAKVDRQARTVGWPLVFTADALDEHRLADAFAYCLTEPARTLARACGRRAAAAVHSLGEDFVAAVGALPAPVAEKGC